MTQKTQVNMLTPVVHQVTTRTKAKSDLWVEQDAVHWQAQEWVEEANAKQAMEILIEPEASGADLTDLQDVK